MYNQHICPKCGGSGARSDSDVKKCTSCNGKGVKMQTRQIGPGFVQQVRGRSSGFPVDVVELVCVYASACVCM